MKHLSKYLQRGNDYLIREEKRRREKKTDDKNSLFNENGEIQPEYPSFAASFGATIIRSKLMPAIFLYAEKSGSGKAKTPLTQLILYMLKDPGDDDYTLSEYVLTRYKKEGKRLEKRVLDASIAAKLCLRTFPIAKKN